MWVSYHLCIVELGFWVLFVYVSLYSVSNTCKMKMCCVPKYFSTRMHGCVHCKTIIRYWKVWTGMKQQPDQNICNTRRCVVRFALDYLQHKIRALMSNWHLKVGCSTVTTQRQRMLISRGTIDYDSNFNKDYYLRMLFMARAIQKYLIAYIRNNCFLFWVFNME